MSDIKLSAIVGLYNQMSDRFMTGGYGQDRDLLQLIKVAGDQGIVQGLELNYDEGGGFNRQNVKVVQALLRDYNLKVAGIAPNLWGQRRWGKGTIGASDPAVRQQAQDFIKRAIDLAAEIGCDFIGLWPGQDGFDYYFEADYQAMYEWWVTGVQSLADHNPNIRLGLEFKPYEPRAHSFINSAAKTLLLLRDIDRTNAGVCFDVGHSLYAHENLGEVVALTQQQGKLFHLHLNDNYGNWDWDLNVGSVHLIAYLEFMYWLRRTGYNGWYSIDIFSLRANPTDSMCESLMWVKQMNALVDTVGQAKFDELVKAGDPIAISRFFRELLLT